MTEAGRRVPDAAEMAEFLALVAVGAVRDAVGGGVVVADGPGEVGASAVLGPRARAARGAGWTVTRRGVWGLSVAGRAAMESLRHTGAVPGDAEMGRRCAAHEAWVAAQPAGRAEPAGSGSRVPSSPVPSRRGPSLLFTPTQGGPSWVVELAGRDAEGLRAALSSRQAWELSELLDAVRAALGR